MRVASDHIMTAGRTVGALLTARDVSAVTWIAVGPSDIRSHLFRGIRGADEPKDDIWPFFVEDARQRPDVTALSKGAEASLRWLAPVLDQPGHVLVVTGREHDLELLAYEGETLYADPPGN
jgi:hypothetical protein